MINLHYFFVAFVVTVCILCIYYPFDDDKE